MSLKPAVQMITVIFNMFFGEDGFDLGSIFNFTGTKGRRVRTPKKEKTLKRNWK